MSSGNRVIDFRKVPDANEFNAVPPGEYLAECVTCEEDVTSNQNLQWKLRFSVVGGDHHGQPIFDSITFTERGLSRVKLVFSRLGGYDVSGDVDLDQVQLIGKRCYLTMEMKREKIEATGQEVDRIRVGFSGFRRIDDVTTAAAAAPQAAPQAQAPAQAAAQHVAPPAVQATPAPTVAPRPAPAQLAPRPATAAAPAANPAPTGDGLPF